MRAAPTIILGLGTILTLACAPGRGDRMARQQGRTYTEWFYGRDFSRLWARFSPEMKRTFASPDELAAFAGRTVEQLGAEQGAPEEQLSHADSLVVYTRTASHAGSGSRMLLQWTMTPDGTVTGFVLRPSADSLPPG